MISLLIFITSCTKAPTNTVDVEPIEKPTVETPVAQKMTLEKYEKKTPVTRLPGIPYRIAPAGTNPTRSHT